MIPSPIPSFPSPTSYTYCVCILPYEKTDLRHTSRHSLKSRGGEGRGGQVEAIRRSRSIQAEEVETSCAGREIVEPHLNRGYTGGKGRRGKKTGLLAVVSKEPRRALASKLPARSLLSRVERRGARGSSRCLTLPWWLTRRAFWCT